MKFKKNSRHSHRRKEHPHSSHSHIPYLGLDPRNGVPIQCQFCSGKSFRRSSLRGDDFTQVLMMRYPVRCLRCNQRQLVSFTVASLALSSSVRPRRRHRPVDPSARWIDFTRHPDLPKPFSTEPTEPAPSTEEEEHSSH
jgi:hypothetical protein